MKRRLSIISTLGLIAVLLIASPAYATSAPDSDPTVDNVKANINLLETGDVLIYGQYDIPYTTIPGDDASKTYIIRLLDTDGTTILGSTNPYPYASFDDGYNEGVFGFYFSASDNLTTDTAYIVEIAQSSSYFDDPESWQYQMQISGWTSASDQDDNQSELAINIINFAEALESDFSVTLLEDSAGGTVLSSPAGETYFRGVIYGVQAMAPSLFLVQSLTWDVEDREWTTAEFDSYGTRFSGTFIDDVSDNVSATFGMDTTTMMSMIFVLPIILGFAVVGSIKWRRIDPSLLVAPLILFLAALVGWFNASVFATIFQLLAMYIGYLLFYSRSGEGMGNKFFGFLAFVWLTSTLICLITEGSWIGTTEQTVINDLSAFTSLNIAGLVSVPAPNLYFFRGVFRILLWDYSFYSGNFVILRFLWLIVFTGSAVYSIGRDSLTVFANFLRVR